MNEDQNQYLSLKTAAGLYGYTRDHLGLMIRQGKLKGIKLGSYYVTTNEWVKDYLKHHADPNHPAAAGKFSNKFLTQAFTVKDKAISFKNVHKSKNKTFEANTQNQPEVTFSKIQKELSLSLRELSVAQEKIDVSSASLIQRHALSGNPYIILPIREMEESERKAILRKISKRNELENDHQEIV